MTAVTNVGKVFEDVQAFLAYLEGLSWGSWRPKFVTMHHTGMPTLGTWGGWQTRKDPVTDEQWLRNLAGYYGNEMGWHACPHFFITPKHICVLSPPVSRGVHAVEFNAVSWGMEVVGDFDREQWAGPIQDRTVDALAAMHLAMGWSPAPYQKGLRGVHFHRDDSTTKKSCPGKRIEKAAVQELVAARMLALQGLSGPAAEHPSERAVPTGDVSKWDGIVAGLTGGDTLNVRADASTRAPIVRTLVNGAKVAILGAVMNGHTKWLALGDGQWAVGQYVQKV